MSKLKFCFSNLMLLLSLVSYSNFSNAQSRNFESLSNADLSIVLPAELDSKLSILAATSQPPALPLFRSAWYDTLRKSFEETSVGSALDIENGFEDWRLVSLRIVPCSPLGDKTSNDPDVYCWPEIRQVWQPIQKNVSINGRINAAFADDRAVHALYDVSPAPSLTPDLATQANQLLSKIKLQVEENGPQVSATELARFVELRNQVSASLMLAALSLRDPAINPLEFKQFGTRPEFGLSPYRSNPRSSDFRNRLVALLQNQTPTINIKELTAFSLPEGRQPPLTDEWVFLKFNGRQGNIKQANIELKSSSNGAVLFDFGLATSVSQQRDDPNLHTALDSGRLGAGVVTQIQSKVVLTGDTSRLQDPISDRRITRVSNTSCGSCHKFNSDKFDMHNMSYLDDRAMALTPRVKKDLELDLQWVKKSL